MKKCLEILVLTIIIPAFGRSQDLFNSVITDVNELSLAKYDSVVEVSGSKDELFNKAKIWFAEAFKSANSVIQTADKDQGIIVGKGSLPFKYVLYVKKRKKIEPAYPAEGRADFTLKIICKDGKFKYIISDVAWKTDSGIEERLDWASVKVAKDSDAKVEKSEYDLSQISKHRALDAGFKDIIASITSKLKKKADTDF